MHVPRDLARQTCGMPGQQRPDSVSYRFSVKAKVDAFYINIQSTQRFLHKG